MIYMLLHAFIPVNNDDNSLSSGDDVFDASISKRTR